MAREGCNPLGGIRAALGPPLLPWIPPLFAPGAANLKCNGRVWIEPAPVVPMGSNISINCQSTLRCSSSQLLVILLNLNLTEGSPVALPGGSARLLVRDFRMPLATVTCFSRCVGSDRDRLVCGTELRAGCE